MNRTTSAGLRATAGAALLVLLLGPTTTVTARESHDGPAARLTSDDGYRDCSLQRLGTQFVRCDYLTGAGAPAPLWVPPYEPVPPPDVWEIDDYPFSSVSRP